MYQLDSVYGFDKLLSQLRKWRVILNTAFWYGDSPDWFSCFMRIIDEDVVRYSELVAIIIDQEMKKLWKEFNEFFRMLAKGLSLFLLPAPRNELSFPHIRVICWYFLADCFFMLTLSFLLPSYVGRGVLVSRLVRVNQPYFLISPSGNSNKF